MKVKTHGWLSALALALLLARTPEVVPSTISYTYDPAGRLVAADYGAAGTISYNYDRAGNLVQSSMPSPGLALSSTDSGQFILTWSAVPGGFVLESAAALGPGAVWAPVNVPIQQIDGRMMATLTPGRGAVYYRLRR